MQSVERYLQVFESLRRGKRWGTDNNVLRFAALTLAATDTTDPDARLRDVAAVLADRAGAFSPLRSSLRHAVAAILIRREADPVVVVRRVEETLRAFKVRGLRHRGMHPLLAALLLVLNEGPRAADGEHIVRLRSIIERWAEDHRFLTGVNDYPMAAMHAMRDVTVERLGLDVERSYRALRGAGFAAGNQLQLVSHLLAFSESGPDQASRRFVRIVAALGTRGQRVWQSHYDEVALLALGRTSETETARKTVDYRDRLRAVRPRPQSSIAFSIATGLVLGEELEKRSSIREAAQLRAVQSLIEAQQAAVIAAMGAAAGAGAAS